MCSLVLPYPFSSYCETLLKGSKDSILHSFRLKLLSNITDYNNNFELLQFHYDLFKTITGAIHCGKSRFCSPLKSLEHKHFTPAYWNWQHRYLIDAIFQFGPPSLFVTLSPYDFPKPVWIDEYLETSGTIPTKLGAIETFHIAHVLDQVLRGYFTGANSKTWETRYKTSALCQKT